MCFPFSRTFATTEGYKPSFQNLYLNQNINIVFEKILEDAKLNNNNDLVSYKDYFDLSYSHNNYQISISLVEDDKNHTFMDVSAKNFHNRGGAKKVLKNTLYYYYDLLKDWVN